MHSKDRQELDAAAIAQLVERHFDIWNDTDAAQRQRKYLEVYTEDVVVADYADKAVGHAEMDRKIDALHGQHAGFVFHPGPAAWNHGVGRVRWWYGLADAAGAVHGEDIFTIEGGKLASLHVFLDKQ